MKTKKLLAALLSSAMVLGTMAVPVFAAEAVTTADDFTAAVAAGGTVELGADITLSAYIPVTKDLTIKGNGHTISSPATRILRVSENNVTLTIDNTKFVGLNNKAERGLQVDSGKTGVKWNLTNVSITGITNYTLNICADAGVTVDAKDCTFTGWGAFNAWSENYVANFDSCTFNGINNKTYNADGWNDFGTIVLEGDTTGQTDMASSNNTVNLNNCKITTESTTGNSQYPIVFNNPSTANVVNITGDKTVVTCNGNTSDMVPYLLGGNVLNIKAGEFVGVDPHEYLAKGYTETIGVDKYTVNPATKVKTEINKAAITDAVTVKSAINEENGTYEQVTATVKDNISDDRTTQFTITASGADNWSKTVKLTDITETEFSGEGGILCGILVTYIPDDVTITIQ